MGKKRIFEIAKDYGVKSTEIIKLLASHNISKTNFSNADDSDIAIISAAFSGKQNSAKADKPQNKEATPKARPSENPVPGKAKPVKVERPSMIVKPVIMTVETNAEGKSTITHNALQKDKSVKPAAPAAAEPKQDPSAIRTATVPAPSNDGKNKYRNVPNNKNHANKAVKPENGNNTDSGSQQKPAVKPVANVQPNQNAGINPSQNRTEAGHPSNARQGQGQNFNRQGSGFGGNRNQGQGQNFNRQGGSFGGNRNQGQGQNFNRQASGSDGNRSQGQGQNFNRQGGSFGGNRNQGQGQNFNRQGSGFGGNRNQGQGQGQNFNRQGGGFGGNRNQGQGQGQNFNRQGGGFGGKERMDKDASQGNKFGSNRPAGRNNAQPRKPAAGAFEEMPRGKESREKYNKKHEKQIKGSYASRDSRPMRSADHMRPAKHQKTKQVTGARPEQHTTVVRPTMVQIAESINVQEFAKLIKREVAEVIKSLFLLGEMVTINQDIDFDTATLVGTEFGVDVQPLPPEEDPTEIPEIEDNPEDQVIRPPVVTVMGHVDHGKTSLLDAIRKTHVTAKEAGGITQHIGAYTVNANGKKITFLDTPGHEAFTAMRARGAQCTDISVLVVAADDGVMPQTVEAINHSKAAGVPIIVAINKMDKPAANPEHVKQQLSEMELIPEDWGGDTIMVPVSAHSHAGIDDLLEMILLVAEVKELKANPKLPAHGTIVEAKLDKGRGPVATVLVQRGTLTIGDYIIAGTAHGRVRALINDRGEKVRKAGPSTPVEVLGLNEVPQAGDILDTADEKTARSVAEKRIAKAKAEQQKAAKVSLDDIFSRIKEGELKELNIVVKADVQGSVEALCASLVKIQNEEVKVSVVHSGVGAINESDVMLASAANALIIGFNVRPDANARKVAETEKVDIRPYRVIYDAINDVEAAIKGMLAPKFEEEVIGRVEVRQVITISKMIIAGCYVTEGKVTNNAKIRVIRDGIVIAEDEMESLRRFKDDVKEVASGYECGITLAKFHDIKEGDQFEAYTMKEVAPQ
ncbi:MAG: translation initiation factor IF-2 [Acidaminococcaceae bacterium]|nr:translation initiation factor IF-2 [Acidaminococcaceae bacterium]